MAVILSPIFKPVGAACNLRCDYCFYRNNHPAETVIMNDVILQKAISQLVQASPQGIHFYWHGGEPLLAGLKFYSKALIFQREICPQNYKVWNSVQTNGTLLSQEWIDFFKEHDFGVGISLDGPEEIHDRHRKFLSGIGTFRSVMDAIELLAKNGMKLSCLAVVSKHSLGKAKQIFNFFYKNGLFSFDLSPCFNKDECGISPFEYAEFMIEIFDIFMDTDDPRVSIRFFDNIISCFLGGAPTVCSMANQAACGLFPTIDWNGDVYFCDNYHADDNSFYLGNVLNNDMNFLLRSLTYKTILQNIKQFQTWLGCLNCEISKMCGGGCPRYWFWREDCFAQCSARRKIVHHVIKRITRIIDEATSDARDGEKGTD